MNPRKGRGAAIKPPTPTTGPASGHSHISLNLNYTLPSELPSGKCFDLKPFIKAYPVNLPYVLNLYLAHDGHDHSDLTIINRYRSRLLRLLKMLRKFGIIHLYRGGDGLCQWLYTENGLNLIRCTHYSNSPKIAAKGIYSMPRRARKERYQALTIAARRPMISDVDRHRIQQNFDTYLEDVNDRSIILCYKADEKNPNAPLLFLPYRTRFTDNGRKKNNLDTYEAIWNATPLHYKEAVFVTLTTDPKMHRSAYHANRHFQIALNRLMSRLNKKLGYRPKYLNVHEFQKNGLLHSHIIIYGLDYLLHQRQLSEMWQQCGQGKIVYIYGLRHNGISWNWSRAKPKDAKKGGTVDSYLKKYLKKALFSPDELELYWTFNKRFFTYSKALKPASPPPGRLGPAFHFIGSARSDEISVTLSRRSRILWSQAQAAAASAGTGPPW